MSVIYHDHSNFKIPPNWRKDTSFKPDQVDLGRIRYQRISKYEEHYGILERILRATLGVFLSLMVVTFAFSSSREFISNTFNSAKHIHYIRVPKGEIVDIRLGTTGNPTHMGHMEMIALAVKRLESENYCIRQVNICLSAQEYTLQKARYCRHNESSPMLKVALSREQRVAFLEAAIEEAKRKQRFEENLEINVFQNERIGSNKNKTFHVFGADFPKDLVFGGNGHRDYPHAIIISREDEEKELNDFQDVHTDNYSRLIVINSNETSTYSSSKVQNGAYELLPLAMREKFKKLRLRAQVNRDEMEKIKCPIAKETGLACLYGGYTNSSGNKRALSLGEQLTLRSETFPNTLIENPMETKYESSTIEVVNLDCLDAAGRELKAGAEKVVVLMLASPIEPGGAMEEGNQGQEEDLCRRSDIFGFMWNQSHFIANKIFYNLVDVNGAHQKNPNYASMKNNKMIHVPGVTVFRSNKIEDYKMLDQPFRIGMLVSPGLDRPDYEKVEGKTKYVRPQDQEQLNKLIMTQLKVAYEESYDTVVLGAFGCGAFFNPPELVAESYKKIINRFFNKAFKKITFAIIDDGSSNQHNPEGNFKPFQACFMS